ncbi:MAG TPA: keto-deoxy-phosphogluconate aldolase, partial [Aeromonadales bacterium]|nr:keto-deoxy-phosphogluconate aldolase [Aeromonadales bacterium]
MNNNLENRLKNTTVIPVLVIENIEDAVPLALALSKGGLKTLEITLRTDNALEALSEIKKALPEILVGAGTV